MSQSRSVTSRLVRYVAIKHSQQLRGLCALCLPDDLQGCCKDPQLKVAKSTT